MDNMKNSTIQPSPKKKLKVWQIVAIIIVGNAIIGGISGVINGGKDKPSNPTNTSTSQEASKEASKEASQPTASKTGTRSNPLKIGETTSLDGMDSIVDTYKDEVTLVEIVRSNEAWAKVKAGNKFNKAPEDGIEYILAKFKVKVTDSKDDQKVSINHLNFEFVSSDGVKYDEPFIIGLKPEFTDIYKGAETEGYSYCKIKKGDIPSIVYLER